MSGYTKLFNSILASTVWSEPNEVRIVWITMLAMANKDGVVEGSIPGLAVFARLSVEETRRALDRLSSPDEDSRSKELNGRRIQPIDGGWQLVNHGKYRQQMSADERREYLRVKQAEHRAKVKRQSTAVNTVSDKSTKSTHTAPAPAPDTEAIPVTNNKLERENRVVTTSTAKSVSLSPAARPKLENPNKDPFLDDAVTQRAGKFVERYQQLYSERRNGARYAIRPARDYAAAVTLCQTWPDDDRLEKLAVCFLTTDHKFAEEGSRTIPQFLALASWCDGKLAEWEKTNGNGARH